MDGDGSFTASQLGHQQWRLLLVVFLEEIRRESSMTVLIATTVESGTVVL